MAMDFGKLNFAVGFNRTSAFPLDANSYFETYDDAVAAAAGAAVVGSADSAYYIGQLLIVKDDTVGVGLYQINAGKTLTKFGQASSADELAEKVSALESRCTTIEGKLVEIEGKISAEADRAKAEEKKNADAIAADVENLANNYYTKTEVEEKIAGKKTAYVYQNKADAQYLEDIKNPDKFKVGDNIYFKAKKVNDQWVAEVLEEPKEDGSYYNFEDLEVDHPSLDGYATKDEVKAVSDNLDKETTRATTEEAAIKADVALKADKTLVDTINELVGTADDEASATGSLFARIKNEAETRQSEDTRLGGLIAANTTAIEGLRGDVGLADDTSEKTTLYGKIAKLQEEIAAAGKIDTVKVNGVALPIEDKAVDITIPESLVKSVEEKELEVSEAGKLSVKAINVNKLEQDEGDTLVLNGGNA